MDEHELLDQALTTGSITPQHFDTVEEIYGPYYRAKGRPIPRHSSLTKNTRVLWREMEQQAHAVMYQGGCWDVLDECVERLASHPECTWKKSTLYYWLRQNYWK